jgi:hypothetical protein
MFKIHKITFLKNQLKIFTYKIKWEYKIKKKKIIEKMILVRLKQFFSNLIANIRGHKLQI